MNLIIKKNLKLINSKVKKINLIKDFDHNYIVVVNGELRSSNFKFEDKNRVRIKNFKNDNFLKENKENPLIYLNHALSDKGYDVEVEDNYKFKKALIVYNLFTKDLKENILNSRNKIKIGENEIEKINNHLRSQEEPDYVDEILNFADEKETGLNLFNNEKQDELYKTALEIVKSEGKASTSFLQRKLQIGYNRAARIIDMMEINGEVSKANHVGKREVLK